jgi:hypothetical protein
MCVRCCPAGAGSFADADPHPDAPSALDGAILSWVLRGDRSWYDGFKNEFGATPDSPKSRVYRDGALSRRALAYAERIVRKQRKLDDPYIRTRMDVVAARIDEVLVDAE